MNSIIWGLAALFLVYGAFTCAVTTVQATAALENGEVGEAIFAIAQIVLIVPGCICCYLGMAIL